MISAAKKSPSRGAYHKVQAPTNQRCAHLGGEGNGPLLVGKNLETGREKKKVTMESRKETVCATCLKKALKGGKGCHGKKKKWGKAASTGGKLFLFRKFSNDIGEVAQRFVVRNLGETSGERGREVTTRTFQSLEVEATKSIST